MPELPEMKIFNVGDKSFKITDADAQDQLLEHSDTLTEHENRLDGHDEDIEAVNDRIVNENMLINSDFICDLYDDADLNKAGWTFNATSELKPQLVNAVGLQILPPVTGAEIITPHWHPAWSATQGIPSIDFPITVSVEYICTNVFHAEDLKVASITYDSDSRMGELVNIAELEEGKYLQVKLTNTGTAMACKSLFTVSAQLSKPLMIRRIKIEKGDTPTPFPQSMKDLALLKVVKDEMINTCMKVDSVEIISRTLTTNANGVIDSNTIWSGGISASDWYVLSVVVLSNLYVSLVGFYNNRYLFVLRDRDTMDAVGSVEVDVKILLIKKPKTF